VVDDTHFPLKEEQYSDLFKKLPLMKENRDGDVSTSLH
jgi:hypothetical protein